MAISGIYVIRIVATSSSKIHPGETTLRPYLAAVAPFGYLIYQPT